MKLLFAFVFLLLELHANNWELKSISFQTENDADIRDDAAYSYGGGISMLYYMPDINSSLCDTYIAFKFTHQLYTPEDFLDPNLIEDDRPYAGYMYLQSGIYQSLNNNLKSYTVQLGIVGPSAQMESVQKLIHSLIGSPNPLGWNNQLNDEIIFQMNYSQKKYYDLDDILKHRYSASIIPEYGVELGNASVKAYISALFRWGKNVPKDYGAYVIDNTNYSKIPLKASQNYSNKKWCFYLNVSFKANAIARNIFLDGNNFQESHSVDKNNFTFDVGYGLSFAYKEFTVDYLRRHISKEFKSQEKLYSYGSLLFSYNY